MKLVIKGLILGVMVAAVIVTVLTFSFLYSTPGKPSEESIFEVKPQSSFNTVAKDLAEEGLISDQKKFKILARVLGHTTKIRVGEYKLNRGMKPIELLNTLTSGKSIIRPITFKEGLNMYEVAEIVESEGLGTKKEFLRLCRDKTLINELLRSSVPTLEGYLFPETYMVTKYTTIKTLIQKMVENFNSVYNRVVNEKPQIVLPRHEAVILASIIEKETGAPEDRPLIASVFHNRLKKGMRLQTDPTILYGILDKTGQMTNNIRKKDITAYTRYNTYVVDGLPYGPISNPGEESIRAALFPATSQNLYFVSRNDGTTVFSTNLKDHNNAVRKFQLDRKMREGRSWRDRAKKGVKNDI